MVGIGLKDSSNPQISLFPLHPELHAKFNSTAAWEYARRMSGKPYGYHNMIFSWIDTVAENYPPPLDAHLHGKMTMGWKEYVGFEDFGDVMLPALVVIYAFFLFPVTSKKVISVMSMRTRLQPACSANMWNEALNKQLGTKGLDLHEILVETETWDSF